MGQQQLSTDSGRTTGNPATRPPCEHLPVAHRAAPSQTLKGRIGFDSTQPATSYNNCVNILQYAAVSVLICCQSDRWGSETPESIGSSKIRYLSFVASNRAIPVADSPFEHQGRLGTDMISS